MMRIHTVKPHQWIIIQQLHAASDLMQQRGREKKKSKSSKFSKHRAGSFYLQCKKLFAKRQQRQLCRSSVIRKDLRVRGFKKNAGILSPKSAAADISNARCRLSALQHHLETAPPPSFFFFLHRLQIVHDAQAVWGGGGFGRYSLALSFSLSLLPSLSVVIHIYHHTDAHAFDCKDTH